MCKILTQSLSCGLKNLSYCCREKKKVVKKMCSRGRMKAGGQEIWGKGSDWIMRRGESKVKSVDILIFITVF